MAKPFDLGEVLIRVYNLLEVRLLHLETTRLHDRVVAEQKVSERLLLNVLPHAIAERLDGSFELEMRGAVEIKGKGSMHTWFLNGRKGQAA